MLAAGMARSPHKETCRLRMEKHLEKEKNPRWKSAADAQEEKCWEARQEEEDKMEVDKVEETVDAEGTKVEVGELCPPALRSSGREGVSQAGGLKAETVVAKRTADITRGAGSSNDPMPGAEKKQ